MQEVQAERSRLDAGQLDLIRRRIRNRLGGNRFTADEVDEVTGIVLVELARAVVRDQVRDVNAWVTHVAEKRAIDLIRRKQREKLRIRPLDDDHLNSISALPQRPALSDDDLASIRSQTIGIFRKLREEAPPKNIEFAESFNCEELLQHFLDQPTWSQLAASVGGTSEEIKRRHARIRKTWERCVKALREKVQGDPHPVWRWAQETLS